MCWGPLCEMGKFPFYQSQRGGFHAFLVQAGSFPSGVCVAYLTSGSAVAACSGRRPFLSGMLCLAPFLSRLTQPSSQPWKAAATATLYKTASYNTGPAFCCCCFGYFFNLDKSLFKLKPLRTTVLTQAPEQRAEVWASSPQVFCLIAAFHMQVDAGALAFPFHFQEPSLGFSCNN